MDPIFVLFIIGSWNWWTLFELNSYILLSGNGDIKT